MKQETLEEAAAKHFNREDLVEGVNIQYVLQCAFIEGAKWQAERMYSEEDLIELLQYCWSESAINLAQQTNGEKFITFAEWIEKNL